MTNRTATVRLALDEESRRLQVPLISASRKVCSRATAPGSRVVPEEKFGEEREALSDEPRWDAAHSSSPTV